MLMSSEVDTLPKILRKNYEKYGDRKISMAVKEYGIWRPYSWKEYYESVKYVCLGLVALGLEEGDKIAILGETKPEAYWAELAVHAMRGVIVGIYTDCLPDEVEYYMNHSESKFLFAHDQEQVDKALQIKQKVPLLKKVIYWDPKGLWSYRDEILISIDEVIKLGKKYEEDNKGFFEKMIDEGRKEDVCILCYTSGTTGDPKGVLISHETIIGQGITWCKEIDQWQEGDKYVSFLPLAWMAEHVMIAATLSSGVVVNFVERPETVQENIRETGPEILFWGARNWESVNRVIQAKIVDATFFNRFLYNLFLIIAYKVSDIKMGGKKPNILLRTLNYLGYWVIFRDLLDRIGLLKVKHAYTGGAPTSPDVIRFFHALGVPIRVMYGSSEFMIISMQRGDDLKHGTSGPPAPGVEIKVTQEGEIIAKGNHIFSGYYKNPEATAERLRDGWYHTQDFGHIAENGHLVVMDRLQDIRTLKNGSKYSPQFIESRIRFSCYIKDILVVGKEENEFTSGLVNIDMDNVGRWAEKNKIPYTSYVDLSQNPAVIGLVKSEFEKMNDLLPEHARIKKFVNLHKEFDPDDAELTRTRKIKREFMEDRYRDIIDAIYNDISRLSVETPVQYRDGTKRKIKVDIVVNAVD